MRCSTCFCSAIFTPLLNMVLNVHRNHKAYQGRKEGGKGVWRWGKRQIIYISLHYHHQNDSCIKMRRDESRFNVSLIVRDKVTRHCPQTSTFEEKYTSVLETTSYIQKLIRKYLLQSTSFCAKPTACKSVKVYQNLFRIQAKKYMC